MAGFYHNKHRQISEKFAYEGFRLICNSECFPVHDIYFDKVVIQKREKQNPFTKTTYDGKKLSLNSKYKILYMLV